MLYHLPCGDSKGQGILTGGLRNGPENLKGYGNDHRGNHDSEDDTTCEETVAGSWASQCLSKNPYEWDYGNNTAEAINNRRDACQDIDDEPDKSPKTIVGVFGQIDGAQETNGYREDHGNGSNLERANDERKETEVATNGVP